MWYLGEIPHDSEHSSPAMGRFRISDPHTELRKLQNPSEHSFLPPLLGGVYNPPFVPNIQTAYLGPMLRDLVHFRDVGMFRCQDGLPSSEA